ncbi:NYN domain-containing protein [Schizophyllum amplum]|uniref:NYN domain-containing protein n=1 Tax=Schizophyllum amplum TaxID=97359 RepID=A0A550CAA2_9AGAR|nr:NYN domain-containing protein [Auriculariopsis ampla]
MAVTASVGIFWDYENCRYTAGRSGFDIARAIERIALGYGTVTTFNAYLDMQHCAIPAGMRSELQSSGVALVDCPHNGQKNVVDQMLQTDMLSYALDHPAPATLILISGDRDFAYTVSVLRRRRYKVALVCHSQPGPHKSLASQVSACLNWNTEILGFPEDPSHRRQWSRSFSFGLAPPISPSSSEGDASYGSDQRNAYSTPSSTATSTDSWRTPPSSPENRAIDVAENELSSNSMAGIQTVLQSTSSHNPEDKAANDPSPCSAVVTLMPEHQSPTATSLVQDVPREYRPLVRVLYEQMKAGFTQPNRGVIGYLLRQKDAAIYERARAKGFSEYVARAREAGMVTLGGGASGGENWIALAEGCERGSRSSAHLLLPSPLPDPGSTTSTLSFLPVVSQGSSSASHSRSASAFKPLIRVLRALRYTVDEIRPKRSLVGNALLATRPDAYTRVGYNCFKDYVQAAQEAGVVEMGGTSGDAWISLHADFAKPGHFPELPNASRSVEPVQSSAVRSMTIDMATSPSSVAGVAIAAATASGISPQAPSAKLATSTLGRVLPCFQPLVHALQQHFKAGHARPLHSVVGASLKADYVNVYQAANVRGFGEYVANASAAGIVILGGTKGGAEWISLTKGLRHVALPPPSPAIITPAIASSTKSSTATNFRLLVQILQEQKQQGRSRPLRSFVGEQLLKRDPNICKKTNTVGCAAYLAQAASLGIVVLSGFSNGAEWVSLAEEDEKAPTVPTLAKASPPKLSAVPAKFRLLVRVLQEYRADGQASPNRGLIGSALPQRDKDVYVKAGVGNFREYAESARDAGIVVLGGSPDGGATWIALEKKWKKVVV